MKAIARKTISFRNKVKIISYSIAIIMVLGTFAISGYVLANKYRQNLEYTYLRALNELSDYVSNIEVTLHKGIYANTSTQQQNICSTLMTQSTGAKNALEQLPVSYSQLDNVNKFISQTGDFASYISKEVSKGNGIAEKEVENIKSLAQYAKSVNTDIQDICAHLGDGQIYIGEPLEKYDTLAKSSEVQKLSLVNSGFKEMNDNFTDYPSMIYDGPFSDHITRKTSVYLEGMDQISKEEALDIAASFIGFNKDQITDEGEIQSNMPVYKFKADSKEISVTKQGGYVSYFLSTRDVVDQKLDFNAANSKALDFLASNQITSLKESYYEIKNGICTINYAFFKDNIIHYPDLIKVSVALDDGTVLSMDATGFLMNHTNRKVPAKILTQSEAAGKISKRLTINNVNKAFIPTTGLGEVFCYEFECTGENNEKVLVYINATSGLEEQIFIVISSEEGYLVM